MFFPLSAFVALLQHKKKKKHTKLLHKVKGSGWHKKPIFMYCTAEGLLFCG